MSSIPTTTTEASQAGGSEEAHKLTSAATGIIGGGVAAGAVVIGALFLLLRWWKARKRSIVPSNQSALETDPTSRMARQYRGLIGSQFTDSRRIVRYSEQREIANPMDQRTMDPSGREWHPIATYPEWI